VIRTVQSRTIPACPTLSSPYKRYNFYANYEAHVWVKVERDERWCRSASSAPHRDGMPALAEKSSLFVGAVPAASPPTAHRLPRRA